MFIWPKLAIDANLESLILIEYNLKPKQLSVYTNVD